jgi:dihydroorotate dehydrogenase electron transfer subunit
MQNVLHADHYADQTLQKTAEIVENVPLAQSTFRVRLACPEIAQRAVPGQFLMVRLAGYDDPLIGRPLALYDTVLDAAGDPCAIDLVYLVKGKFTSRLVTFQPGQALEIWGPLGNGFPPESTEHLIMVAGGIGQTPFLALGQEYLGLRRYGPATRVPPKAPRVSLLYGARTAALLAGVEDFERCGIELRLATDDGSQGHHGLVTELLDELLSAPEALRRIVCCGPEPMMEAVAKVAADRQTACQVSLETPMACGVGICFTCVAKVRDASGDWDYRRTCVEGPVFDAAKIDFR